MEGTGASSSSPPAPPQVSTSPPKEPLHKQPRTDTGSSASGSPSASSSTPGKGAASPSIVSPERRALRVLDKALEDVFQMTVRPGNSSDGKRNMEAYCEDKYISNRNISNLICMRLAEGRERGGAVGYLTACHARLCTKERESSSDKLREDLQDCRRQVVSFLASSLAETDMFGDNSANSTHDLLAWMVEVPMRDMQVVKEVLTELETQDALDEVLGGLVQEAVVRTQTLSPSVVDEPQPASLLFEALCKVDKRVARKVAKLPSFLVDAAKGTAKPPQNPMPMHFMTPQLLASMAVQGAALEALTPVGRMLRVSADFQTRQNFEFLKDAHKSTRQTMEGKIKQLRDSLGRVQTSVQETLLALLKASKDDTLAWLVQSVTLNAEAAKDQPNRLAASSPGMLLNLGSVMLRLCRPFISDIEKLRKVDWGFLGSAGGLRVFPKDDMRLLQMGEDQGGDVPPAPAAGTEKDYNFITQSFFLCWRALHVGVVGEINSYRNHIRRLHHFHGGLATGEPQAVQALTIKLLADVPMMSPDLVADLLGFTEGACTSLMEQLNVGASGGVPVGSSSSSGEDWVLPRSSCPPTVLALLTQVPEHLLTDIMEILLFVAKTQPSALCVGRLDSVLSLCVYFLRRPWAVASPHLRAKFGQVLYYIFLPVANMPGEERWSGEAPRDGNHSLLLGTLVEAQNNLAPALLLLYGDVEKTGFYEKLTHRRHIMVVLKHLWHLPTHRPAFRGIAKSKSGAAEGGDAADGQDDEADVSYFIRFANGLLNETNTLVSQTVETLGTIRKFDLERADTVAWSRMSEDEREQHQSRYSEAEQQVTGTAGLCLETLDMLAFLCSDEEIRQPFIIDEILQRFVSMLTNVLNWLTGSKSVEIKVAPERWAQYNFNPKQMLTRVCQTMGYYKSYDPFCEAMAKDGFYGDGSPLKKAIGTVVKYNMLNAEEVQALTTLLESTEKARQATVDLDAILEDAPNEFMDPLLLTLMRDPVKLPTSGTVVDRSTIATQLLNNELDPFNRQPLQLKDVIPDVELKTRIDEWLLSKGVKL